MEWSKKGTQERGISVGLERYSRVSLDAGHGKDSVEKLLSMKIIILLP